MKRFKLVTPEDIATIEIITTRDNCLRDMKRLRELIPTLKTSTEILGPVYRGDFLRVTLQVHVNKRRWCIERIQMAGLDVAA